MTETEEQRLEREAKFSEFLASQPTEIKELILLKLDDKYEEGYDDAYNLYSD